MPKTPGCAFCDPVWLSGNPARCALWYAMVPGGAMRYRIARCAMAGIVLLWPALASAPAAGAEPTNLPDAASARLFRDLSVNYVAATARRIMRDNAAEDGQILAAARLVTERFKRAPGRPPAPLAAMPNAAVYAFADGRIPLSARLPLGAAEYIAADRACDSAARALQFVLSQMGYESTQLNLALGRNGGHSALLVTRKDGSKAYVDPYLGLAAGDKERLQGIDVLAASLRSGKSPRSVLLPLKKNADYRGYANWSRQPVFYAGEREDIDIRVALPSLKGRAITLGRRNKSATDVMSAALRHSLTPFFHFLGSRYDPAWNRTLLARENVKISVILTDRPKPEALRTNLAYRIKGNSVSWSVPAGSSLTFAAGAPTYQDVDLIVVKPWHRKAARGNLVKIKAVAWRGNAAGS
jgi:hypothetical protein